MLSTFHIKKMLLLISLLFLAELAFSQQADSTKNVLSVSGTISANNNGFSLVPTFSLGKPAIQTGFNIEGKGRLSFQPQFWYSMLDYKPWSFIFIWRYKVIKKDKFQVILGTHAPAINFKSGNVTEDGVEKDIVKARRFYPALEVMPVYHLNKHTSLSLYYLFGKGIETEVASANSFLSLRADFNDIPLTKKLYLRFNPQLYYLKINQADGLYMAAGATLAHRKLPFSLSSMINMELTSAIDTENFVWNVGINYSFRKQYVEQ